MKAQTKLARVLVRMAHHQRKLLRQFTEQERRLRKQLERFEAHARSIE